MKNYIKSSLVFIGLFINKTLSLNIQKPICNNIEIRSCKDCKHFILDTEKIEYGKCDLSYLTGLVTGKKYYNYAIMNRINNLGCGIDAKFFETPHDSSSLQQEESYEKDENKTESNI